MHYTCCNVLCHVASHLYGLRNHSIRDVSSYLDQRAQRLSRDQQAREKEQVAERRTKRQTRYKKMEGQRGHEFCFDKRNDKRNTLAICSVTGRFLMYSSSSFFMYTLSASMASVRHFVLRTNSSCRRLFSFWHFSSTAPGTHGESRQAVERRLPRSGILTNFYQFLQILSDTLCLLLIISSLCLDLIKLQKQSMRLAASQAKWIPS